MGTEPVKPLSTGQWIRRWIRRVLRKRRTLMVAFWMVKAIVYLARLFVSVRRPPRAAQLDGLKFHGSSSSRRLFGWPLAMADRVALR
jgi:hypothetical protein